jgi:hypothetical protein
MKFAKCRFKPGDTRLYTYKNPGLEIVPGDFVKVADNRSDGWKRVEVVELTDDEPPFACKPLLGIYNPDTEAAARPEPIEADDLMSGSSGF